MPLVAEKLLETSVLLEVQKPKELYFGTITKIDPFTKYDGKKHKSNVGILMQSLGQLKQLLKAF